MNAQEFNEAARRLPLTAYDENGMLRLSTSAIGRRRSIIVDPDLAPALLEELRHAVSPAGNTTSDYGAVYAILGAFEIGATAGGRVYS